MAIDDNTSYELTGAQVKDLASKINSKADASSVPAPQVNSDWNATSGVAEILNKPTIPNGQKLFYFDTNPFSAAALTSGVSVEDENHLATTWKDVYDAYIDGGVIFSDGLSAESFYVPTRMRKEYDSQEDTTSLQVSLIRTSSTGKNQNVLIQCYDWTSGYALDVYAGRAAKDETFTGTDGTAAGAAGLVPAPATTDAGKYLKADGTWSAVSSGSSDAVTLYATLDNLTNRFTFYHDASHTQAVSWNEFVALAETKNIAFAYTETSTNDPYTIQIVSSSLWAGDNKIVFFGFWYDEFFEFTWSSSNSYVTTSPAHASAGVDVWYATSSSNASSSTKSARTQGGGGAFTLQTGTVVFVKFAYQNTSTNTLSLNVDSSGSKSVYVNGSQTDASYTWKANDVVGFVYDGTYWRMLSHGKADSTTYGLVKIGTSYTSSSSSTVPTNSQLYSVYTIANNKQDQLYAGQGISISGNTISATNAGSTYTYSGAVDTTNNSFTTTITDNNSVAQNVTLNAGNNITFSSSTALGKVGPTIVPNTTAAYYADITSLTFTPTNANLGYFFVLRVYKEYQMASGTNMYQATLYLSNTTYSYSSAAEVSAAINNEQIIVNPDFMAFSNYFTQINQSSFQSDAATAISQVSGVPANFGGTIDSFGQATYVDVYVYVLNESAFTISATGGSGGGAVTYYMTSGTTQGIPSYQTYIYSDAARTTVVDPDTILAAYEGGNTILLKYESTQTGSSAYDMTLQVNSMSLTGEDGYKMLVSELNADNGNYNAVNTLIQATWDGTGTFSGRWVLVRNVYNKNALIIREWS